MESHRDGTLELLWRLARDLAIPALAPRAALLRETARARLLAQQAYISPYLPYISPISPLYLPPLASRSRPA